MTTMITEETRLRQYRSLADVDIDMLIRKAHFERNRLVARQLRTSLRGIGKAFAQLWPKGALTRPRQVRG
jgi:hypothetical protein